MMEYKDPQEHAFPLCPGQEGIIYEKFMAKVKVGNDEECWNWLGCKSPKGYGVLSYSKRGQMRAHRASFMLHNGREARDMVLHLCDNPSCVNPSHLMDGSHGENMRQMADRKRAVREESHHKAKLNTHKVMAIISLHKSGEYSTRELADMFYVSQPTVASIVKGDLWKDVYSEVMAMLEARK